MSDKLSQFDRRMEILSILRRNKIVKRRMLAQESSVSKMIISEDLKALNRYAPICAKMGPYGGIYLSSDYYAVEHNGIIKRIFNLNINFIRVNKALYAYLLIIAHLKCVHGVFKPVRQNNC